MLRVLADTFNFEIDPVVIQNGRKLHFSAVGSNKYIGRARPHLWVISLSLFGRNSSISVRKYDPLLAKSHVEGQYCLPEFVPFSVPRSIFDESRFQISHQNVITIFEPETNLWWSIWQFWEILLTNICTDLLFGMRYQEDVFCQPRNETFFHGFVENSLVLVLFVMVLPCNMICDIDFSFKMTHPLSRYQKMHDFLPGVSCFG